MSSALVVIDPRFEMRWARLRLGFATCKRERKALKARISELGEQILMRRMAAQKAGAQ